MDFGDLDRPTMNDRGIIHPELASLLSIEKSGDYAAIGSAEALRAALTRDSRVRHLIDHIKTGSVTAANMQDFVNTLLRRFVVGTYFEHQVALAALSVALEDYYSEYSDRFLSELSSLRLSELQLPIFVAQASLRRRHSGAGAESRRFTYPFPLMISHAPKGKAEDRSESMLQGSRSLVHNKTKRYQLCQDSDI